MKFFSRSRSGTSKSRSPSSSAEYISQADLESFGMERFEYLSKNFGRQNAIEQVLRQQRKPSTVGAISQQASSSYDMEEDSESFGIEDTDLWVTEDSVECVLGGI